MVELRMVSASSLMESVVALVVFSVLVVMVGWLMNSFWGNDHTVQDQQLIYSAQHPFDQRESQFTHERILVETLPFDQAGRLLHQRIFVLSVAGDTIHSMNKLIPNMD